MGLKLIDHDGNAHNLNEVLEFFKAHKNAETRATFDEQLAAFVKTQAKPVPAPLPSPEQQLERVLASQRERLLTALDGASTLGGGSTYEARLKFKLDSTLVDELAAAGYGVSGGNGNNSVVSWTFKPRAVYASLAGGSATLSNKGYGGSGGVQTFTLGDGLIRDGDPGVVSNHVPYEPRLPSAARSRQDRDARHWGGTLVDQLRLIEKLIREAKPNTNGGCLAHYHYEFELPVLSLEHRVQVLKLLADQGYGSASRYRNGNPEQNYTTVLF